MAEPLGVIYVRWIDATMDGHWGDETDPHKLAAKTASPCQSIGFLMYEDDTAIVLCQSLDSEYFPGNQIAIPKIAVQERRIVRVRIADKVEGGK